MREKAVVILSLVLIFAVSGFAAASAGSIVKSDVVAISVERQHEIVRPGSKSALAVHFELAEDWHFYASGETAPPAVPPLRSSSSTEISRSELSLPLFMPWIARMLSTRPSESICSVTLKLIKLMASESE